MFNGSFVIHYRPLRPQLNFFRVLNAAHGLNTWLTQTLERGAPQAGAGTQATRVETVRDRGRPWRLSRRGQPVGGGVPCARP